MHCHPHRQLRLRKKITSGSSVCGQRAFQTPMNLSWPQIRCSRLLYLFRIFVQPSQKRFSGHLNFVARSYAWSRRISCACSNTSRLLSPQGLRPLWYLKSIQRVRGLECRKVSQSIGRYSPSGPIPTMCLTLILSGSPLLNRYVMRSKPRLHLHLRRKRR